MAEEKTTTCTGCSGTVFRYQPSKNEAGWKCSYCGAKAGEDGYCPDLDRLDTEGKVGDLLLQMCGGLGGPEFLSLSNGSEGDTIAYNVARRCVDSGRYDQYFILWEFLCHLQADHSDYWKKVADGKA